jgi:putative FmdB family regulatory protein
MPIYEYQCAGCSNQFSLLQSIHTKPGETACPSCGATRVERLISRFAAKTYGSGDADPSGGTSCTHGGDGCGH